MNDTHPQLYAATNAADTIWPHLRDTARALIANQGDTDETLVLITEYLEMVNIASMALLALRTTLLEETEKVQS